MPKTWTKPTLKWLITTKKKLHLLIWTKTTNTSYKTHLTRNFYVIKVTYDILFSQFVPTFSYLVRFFCMSHILNIVQELCKNYFILAIVVFNITCSENKLNFLLKKFFYKPHVTQHTKPQLANIFDSHCLKFI